MKKYSLFLIVFLSVWIVGANAQTFPIDTAKLNRSYDELMAMPNAPEKQQRFLDAFPNTWMEFIMTYQYMPGEGYDLTMYKNAAQHIKALSEKMTLIPDAAYCAKIVNVALGARWDADAPNYLQSLLRSAMQEKTAEMLDYINTLNASSQMEFWQFFWSSLHKVSSLEKLCHDLRESYHNTYPQQMEIMRTAFTYFHGGVNIPASSNYPAMK